MKRSEMIELMVHRLEGYAEKNPSCSTAELMSYVLRGMEAIGVLPPPVELLKLDTVYTRTWEPETVEPTPLTDEELADIIANDEDLQNEKK